ncbi:MAG: TIGR04283 family arsenosugar biosynthesis glycosyltransferase [Acidobacteria bacterium]|nr:TIGR04283 family arsenosugar biosynthesis glycosyltransferase [Acidobacteriota bacterium]
MVLADEGQSVAISIIVPTLNEENSITQTLSALARLDGSVEVVVVDGGSDDETGQLVRACGVRLIESERGRGAQMHAGALATRGSVFWFLHADTSPPADAIKHILESLRDPRVVGGNFNVSFDSNRFSALYLTWLYRRLRSVGLCYGDSAIFVTREAYERTGGFKSLPIFEDLDFLRRLKRRGKFVHLSSTVITSGRRFEGGTFVGTFMRWTALQLLYWLGVNPGRLGAFYLPIREGGDRLSGLTRDSSNRAET